MTERHTPSPGELVAWDAAALAAALDRPPEPTTDVAFGDGLRFRLGEARPVDLELFPTSGVVRVTGADVQLALFRQHAGPRLAPEGLVFALPHRPDGRFLSVSPGGEVTLFLVAPDASTAVEQRAAFLRPQDGPGPADRRMPRPAPAAPLPADPVPSRTPSQDASPNPPASSRPHAEQERLPRLTGRLGGNPRFHTAGDRLVGEFDLAVKDPDDPTTTRWHRVVVFGTRAEALRDGPKKGDVVDVIGGYRHLREVTGKDGRTRTKEEVYATVVRPR